MAKSTDRAKKKLELGWCWGQLPSRYIQEVWNQQARKWTNCLAYALGDPQVGWAIPGQLMTQDTRALEPSEINKVVLEDYLAKDKLVSMDEDAAFRRLDQIHRDHELQEEFALIAVYVKPGVDAHFFRYNFERAAWAHKVANRSVRYVPCDRWGGAYGVDLKAAKRQEYCDFAGYWSFPKQGVPFIKRLEIELSTPCAIDLY